MGAVTSTLTWAQMLGSKPNINSWTVIFITFIIILVKNFMLMLLLKVQIRKLYQPNLFPNASVLPIFDKFFGPIETRFRHIVSLKYRHQFSGTWKLFVQLALNQIHIIMRRWCSWRNIIKIVAGGSVFEKLFQFFRFHDSIDSFKWALWDLVG